MDGQFSRIASELVDAKKVDIVNHFNDAIKGCPFDDAHVVVRGSLFDYTSAQKDAVTKAFWDQCRPALTATLREDVINEINKKSVVSTWNGLIEKVNAGNKLIADARKAPVEAPAKLDIGQYIVEQIIELLMKLMRKREAEVRQDPKGSANGAV